MSRTSRSKGHSNRLRAIFELPGHQWGEKAVWFFRKTRLSVNVAATLQELLKSMVNLPGFWQNPYVLGFVYTLSFHRIMRDTKNKISAGDIGCIMYNVFERVDEINGGELLRTVAGYIENKNPLTEEGIKDANSINQFIAEPERNYDDPIIKYAKHLVLEISDNDPYWKGVSYNNKVVGIIFQITFKEMVSEIWHIIP